MYKDVKEKFSWKTMKKVLAVVVSICLVVTIVQLPDITAHAQDGVVYHDYWNASEGELSAVDEKTVAALFTIGQNEKGAAEQLESVSFDLHKNIALDAESANTATATVYVNPSNANDPTSGNYLCEVNAQGSLEEGTNRIQLNATQAALGAGTVVAVVVSLNGDDFSFQENASNETGKTFVQTTEGWVDAGTRSQCVNVSLKTSDVAAKDADVVAADTTDDVENAVQDETSTEAAQDEQNVTDTEETSDETNADEIAAYSNEEDGIALTASNPIDITDDMIELVSNATASSDGSEVRPIIKVTYQGTVLEEGTDYTCSVRKLTSGNTWSDVGTEAQIVVTGMGNYTSFATCNYKVCADVATQLDVPEISAQTYTGSPITLNSLYTIHPDSALTADDLNVEYKDNLNAGTATVTISPKISTEFGGKIEKTFTINKVDISTLPESAFTYDKKVVYNPTAAVTPPTVTVSYNNNTLTAGADYKVTSSGFDKAGTANITLDADNGTNDVKNYTGSKNLSVTVDPCSLSGSNITVTLDNTKFTYTGSSITPGTIVMKYGDTTIYEKGDNKSLFKVTYKDANGGTNTTDYGVITGTIEPTDTNANYTGAKTFTYEITKTTLSSDNIELTHDDSKNYNNAALVQYVKDNGLLAVKLLSGSTAVTLDSDEVTLKDKNTGHVLTSSDFTTSYQYNKSVSTSSSRAQVTFTGKGNYTGSMTVSFLIAQDISTLKNIPTSFDPLPYKGNGKEVTYADGAVIIKNDDNEILTKGEDSSADYTVEYSDNTAIGTAVYKIVGNGNVTSKGCFVGSVEKNFTITKKNLADEDVVVTINPVDYVEGTSETTLNFDQIEVKYGDETLQGGASRDYIIQGYEGNDKCGTAYVTLQGVGDNYTGTKTVPFYIRGKEISAAGGYTIEVENYTYTGGNIIPEIKVIKDKGTATEAVLDRKNYTISYQQNGSPATPQDAGEYDVIVSGNNNNNYTGELVGSFSVLQRPINDSKITQNQLSAAAYPFTGNQIKPNIVLSHELSGSTVKLVEGTDYTVAYENNVNAGDTAKAIVSGIGNYSGTREITFTIAKKSLKEADVVIDPIGVQAYTGKAIEPRPTVKLGDYELQEGVDFEYYYSNNVEIGTNKATVGIRALENGNFQLQKAVTFSIQASISSNCDMTFTDTVDESGECYYTGSAIKPGVKVVDEKSGATLRQGTDYVVTYSNNMNAGTATVSVRGIGSYTSSIDKTFTIKPVNMEDVIVNLTNGSKTFTYTGSQIQPTIRSITYGNYTLASNDTYNVAYGANTNVSEGGTITITSTGSNFEGTQEVAFTIQPKDISKSATAFANDILLSADGESVTLIPTQSYTGTTITPEILLQYKVSATDTKALALNTDYTVLVENNIDPGVATMTFTGVANYTGTVKQNFTIARDISGATVEGIEETYPYTRNEVKVEDNLKVSLIGSDGDPYQLDPADYNVTYKDNVKAGTATVTISGNEKNFYTGSVEKTFKIKADFADESTTVAEIEDVPRDPSDNSGKTYHPEALSITCGGNTFNNAESNENYDVTYENDTKIGTATITLTGKGDFYEGTRTVTYDIVPANSTFKITYKNGEKIPDQKFCGKGITFDPESEDFPFTVSYVEEDGVTERELVYGKDYELKYNNNVNANVTLQDDGSFQDTATKAEVVIHGIGKYKHENKSTCTFTILPLLLDDLVIDDSKFLPEGSEDIIGPREYTGKTVTPSEIQIQNVDTETGDVIYTLTKDDYTLTPVTEVTGEDGSVVKTYSYEAGSKTACVTIKGNGLNCIGTKTIEYDIAQMDIAKTKITTTAQEYTGYALQPDVQVVNPLNDNAVLVLNEDYFLEYDNNVDAGVATVRVVANDTDGHNFKGTAEATFKINPIAITASSITVDEIPSQDYSGAGVTPDVAISYTDPQGVVNALHEGTDYELSYANNTKAGTARVTIAGKGNFTGTTAKPFTITPCDIGEDNVNITIDPIGNQAYTGSNITPNVTVKDRDYQMKSGVDYTVTYSNNKELGIATATVVGKGNYTGSRSTTFQIASDISKAVIGNGVAKEYTYTGTEICPVPSNVHIGTTNLVAGTDYTVSYEENTNAGTGKVILSGMGTYGGTLEQTFTIKQKDISDSDVKMTGYTDKATYTETEVTLPIGFTYGTMTLEQDTDFVISYTDNFALGTAYFEVVGLGNYTGTITKKFEIVKKSVDDSDITVTDMSSTYTYEGEEIAPVPTLNNGDEKMTPDIDYTVAYENNNGVGVATMTITGIGRYQGSREVKYNILRKSVVNCKTSDVGTQVYTGADIEPTVTVKDGDKDLVKGTDYTIMYSNNRKSGSGAVIIAGKGNYTVTKTIRFDIRPGGTNNFMVNTTTNDSIGLAWGAQGVVTGYEIYRADASGNYTRIARTRGTSYTDKGLNAGTAYTYKVRAYLVADDETYYSNFSDGVTGTTNN